MLLLLLDQKLITHNVGVEMFVVGLSQPMYTYLMNPAEIVSVMT